MFHKAYPGIRGTYYPGLTQEIVTTGMLKGRILFLDSPSLDPAQALYIDREPDTKLFDELLTKQGVWTRRCFGNPVKNKMDLNSYISHPPQCASAQTLNRAFLSVFKDIALNPTYSDNFKLIAQIHDSILFQYRIGHEDLQQKVIDKLEIPMACKGYDDKVRTFYIPCEAKGGAEYWNET